MSWSSIVWNHWRCPLVNNVWINQCSWNHPFSPHQHQSCLCILDALNTLSSLIIWTGALWIGHCLTSFQVFIKEQLFNVHENRLYLKNPWKSAQMSAPLCYDTQTEILYRTWDVSKNLHGRRFQGKKFTQKTRNFRHLLNRDKKCVNALNWDKTSKKCSVTM